MGFDPKYLAPTVYDAYKQGPIAWVFVVRTAFDVGYRNFDTLTDIAFYLHHPELNGKKLKSGQSELIAQWKGFHKLIKTMLPILSKSTATTKTNHTYLDNFGERRSSNLEPVWQVEEGEG